MRAGRKKSLISILLTIGISLLLFGWLWWIWANQPRCHDLPDQKECPEILFMVKKGESVNEISQNLLNKNLIKSPLFFKIQLVLKNLSGKIQAGDYYLSASKNNLEIAQSLTKGSLDKKVTIVEGWRAEEIGESLIKSGIELDLSLWREKIVKEELEGHLFPDTYMIPVRADIEKIINILFKNFNRKFSSGLEAEGLKKGIDKQSILIFASLIEREVPHEEDRPIIAGILLKRLKENWPLQVDATVQYALASIKCNVFSGKAGEQNAKCDWWPKKLTSADLKIKSAYNTYLYRGLPPGPICNPGLSAIKSVINSQDSPYWYYLSDSKGTIHYAKTDLEHLENIRKYLAR